MDEKWAYIEGSINGYVSSLGRIKDNEKIMVPTSDPEGYLRCAIKGFGTERIHRLVAKYFVPNPNKLNIVDHIDRNKKNNRSDNLRWVTSSENGKNAIYSKARYEPIIGINIKTNEIKEFKTQVEAGKYIGVKDPIHGGEINKVLRGKRKTTHGWTFYYKSDYEKFDKTKIF